VDTDTEEEPLDCLTTTKTLQAIAMRMLQEEMVSIQVPQEEMMQKMVMMIQLHPMVVTRIQMMIQSQPTQQ
jgi:hypothetical protein